MDRELKRILGLQVRPVTKNDDDRERYRRWKQLVNMTKRELEKFIESEDGQKAGLTPAQARAKGIKSGQTSARWIVRMKSLPFSEWGNKELEWMRRQIAFISRMSGVKAPFYKKGKPTRLLLALKIWGHDPEK